MSEELLISCKHIINKEREGFWSEDMEVILCEECWKKINKLEKKYKGNIPIEELGFVQSYCRHCIDKVLS